VEDVDNSSFNNEFRLHCRSRSFIIYAMTAEQKKVWVEDLKKSIEGTHQEEKKKTDINKKDPDPKDEVRKTKKETKTSEKGNKSDPDTKEPEQEPKKKEHRNKSKKASQKVAKPEENNILPFDPFAPVATQQRPTTSNPFSPSPVANPFHGAGLSAQQPLQPNLITTGGNFDLGYNPSLGGGLQVNMGFNVGLNQPLAANPFNPNAGLNQVNVGFNQPGSYNQPGSLNQPSNLFPAGPLNVAGTNPFTSGPGFNNQQITASNPFTGATQNTNPFLNPSSSTFSNQNQNPLF